MTKRTIYKTREEWFQEFTRRARPVFKKAGFPIPKKVRVSCGFPAQGARSKVIGQCWDSVVSGDKTFEIFIVPRIADASRAADILTHELIHAAVGLACGHKGDFVACMKAVGLVGKATATTAGPGWHAWADEIMDELGRYPHAELTPGEGRKKQTTRMVKCTCQDCELVFRTSMKWIETCPWMRCPNPDCDGEVEFT